MSAYMLLLYDGPAYLDLSPDEMQKIIKNYSAWRQGLEDSGRLLSSDKLYDGEGRVLRHQNGKVRILDGPFSETKEIVGGYFAIEAADYDEAVAIARDCPHLEFGAVEVRQIDRVTGCGAE